MNKTPIITIIALLVVILIAFSGCEFEINLNGEESNTETSVETVVVTDEEGSTQIETVVHYITTEPVPVVTIVEVTNEKGKVVETEKITLSPQEVQQGKDFFNGKDDKKENQKETEKATEISKEPASDRITTVPEKENVEVQDDFAILNSSKYLIEGRVVTKDGTIFDPIVPDLAKKLADGDGRVYEGSNEIVCAPVPCTIECASRCFVTVGAQE